MRKRRWIWIIVAVVVVLAGAGGFLLWRQSGTSAASTAARTVPVRKGTLEVTVNASGSLEPVRQVDLSFDVSGKVAEVQVDIGDAVKRRAGAGPPGCDGDLEPSLRQAEAATEVRPGPTGATAPRPRRPRRDQGRRGVLLQRAGPVPAAEKQPLPEETIASAKATLETGAHVTLERAQRRLRTGSPGGPTSACSPQSLQPTETATLDYQVALANYQAAVKGASPGGTGGRLAATWRAPRPATGAGAPNGPTEEDLTVAEAAVEQARGRL